MLSACADCSIDWRMILPPKAFMNFTARSVGPIVRVRRPATQGVREFGSAFRAEGSTSG
jgi:hypothetical protein